MIDFLREYSPVIISPLIWMAIIFGLIAAPPFFMKEPLTLAALVFFVYKMIWVNVQYYRYGTDGWE
ncbi:MAG: hypothetical protein HYR79_05505 [Nitrospirae bacterium]|nr:hypothetical protein [Nitrospirota bacterium]